MNPKQKQLVRLGFIGVVYAMTYKLSLFLPDSAGIIAAVWPASGITLALLLLHPRRQWPPILLILFAVSFLVNLSSGKTVASVLGFAVANLSEPLLGALIFTRLRGERVTFMRVADFVVLIAVATLANACTAIVGAATASLSSDFSFWGFWLTWWVSNGLGILLVTPVVVTAVRGDDSRTLVQGKWALELGAVIVVSFAIAWAYFGPYRESYFIRPHSYMPIVPLIWAAIRLGPLGTSVTLLLLAVTEIGITVAGVGSFPLGGHTPSEYVLWVQLYLGVKCVIAQLLAASVAERKASQQTLRDSEKRLRAIADNLPEGMVYQVVREHDGTMRFLYVSAAIERLNGLSVETVLRDSSVLYNQIVDDDKMNLATMENVSAKTMSVFHVVVRMQRADGEVRWMDISSSPRLLPDGRILWDGIQTDITDRKKTEEIVRESEERYRIVAETATDAIVTIDQNSIIQFANSATSRVFGYVEDELVGKNLTMLMPEYLRHVHEVSLERYVRTGKKHIGWESTQLPGLHKSGVEIPLELSFGEFVRNGNHYFTGIIRDITARKQAEEALRQSEERMRAIIEGTPYLFFYRQDAEANSTYVSPTVEHVTGYKPDVWLKRKDWFITDAALNQIAREATHTHLRGIFDDKSILMEVQHANGNPILLEAFEHPVIRDGRIVGLQGVAHDITQRHRAEEQLHRVNRALRTISNCNQVLVRASNEGELLQDICNVIVEFGGYRMTWVGFAEDDERKTVRPVAHAGHGGEYLETLNLTWADTESVGGPSGTAIRTGQPAACRDFQTDPSVRPWREKAIEYGYSSSLALPLKRAGKTFGVLSVYSADSVSFDADETALLIEMAEDLAFGINALRVRDDHARAEKQIEQQARLLDVARDAIIVRDMDDKLIYVNRAAEELYGWTFEEAAVMPSDLMMADSDREKFIQTRKDFVERGEWEGELRQKTKNGKELIIQTRWTLVRDKQGNPSARLVINRDVTEQRNLESQVRRTQRLESLGTLAGGIAHDLNNILAPIMMSLSLLDHKVKDPSLKKWIASLETSAQRGTDIIKQVLMFARGSEKEFAPQQLRYVVREIAAMIGQTFPKNVKLSTDIPNDLAFVNGDATQLHQILMNLCVNARDAMPDGGDLTINASNVTLGQADIAMHADATPGPYVVLSVSDTGSGIPKEIHEKIFEPFFTTKEVGKGTGLGLSTVYSIVKEHKGFINLYSEIGNGTTFKVYLPTIKQGTLTQSPGQQNILPSGNGEVILVVDDEQSILQFSKGLLEMYGYQVLTAENGLEAVGILEARERKSIDLVLTDINMPIMGGPAAVNAMRKIDQHFKVIFASGLVTGQGQTQLKGMTFDGYLSKPYTAERMLTMLHEVFKEKKEATA